MNLKPVSAPLVSELPLMTLHKLESDYIQSVLFRVKGNMTAASKQLGIGRATLYRKVKHYGLARGSGE